MQKTKAKLSKVRRGIKDSQDTKVIMDDSQRASISTLRKNIVPLALDRIFVNGYDNIRKLNELGFHNSAIVMCCKNKRDNHKSYKWMDKEDYHLINMKGTIKFIFDSIRK